jgi:hypothetical protein
MATEQIKLAEHSSERSGHWYTRQGEQVETVPGSKGDPVKPDIRHARKLGLLPGVTTIINCAGVGHGIVNWKVEKAIGLVRENPIQEHEPDKEYIKRIKEGLDLLSRRDEGTALHASIQKRIEGGEGEARHAATVAALMTQLESLDFFGPWQTEKIRVHPLGFGTRSDLSTDLWLADLKTKDGDLDDLREEKTWPGHWQQLAATREAIGNRALRCAIVFVSRTHDGVVWPVEVKEDKLARGWEMFQCMHGFWRSLNDYNPGWKQ